MNLIPIKQSWLFLFFITILWQSPAYAGNSKQAVTDLQKQWAIDNYQLKGKAQKKAFEQLLQTADRYLDENPDDAAVLVWSGIIKSTYAGIKGGFGAMKYAKASRKDLEKALGINPNVLQGSAYTSLGTLYYKVPGWPIGFGDDDKARELLQKSLAINPEGIDSNYFYGDFLLDEGEYHEAEKYLLKAQKAANRPGREIADKGRREEIQAALEKARSKF